LERHDFLLLGTIGSMKSLAEQFLKIKHPFFAIVSFTSLVLFMMLASPSETSFAISVVPLVLLWLVVYFFVRSISTRKLERLFKNAALTAATVVTLLVMFSALGELALFDVALLISLSFLVTFYLRRSWPK
jgi:hypothetical protein